MLYSHCIWGYVWLIVCEQSGSSQLASERNRFVVSRRGLKFQLAIEGNRFEVLILREKTQVENVPLHTRLLVEEREEPLMLFAPHEEGHRLYDSGE